MGKKADKGPRPVTSGATRRLKTVQADPALVIAIREILASSPFHGEGYRKVRARLAHRGLPVSGKRVLRVMRQHRLLAPRRLGHRTTAQARADARGRAA